MGQGGLLCVIAFFLPLIQIVAGMIGVPGPGIIPILTAALLSKAKKTSMRC